MQQFFLEKFYHAHVPKEKADVLRNLLRRWNVDASSPDAVSRVIDTYMYTVMLPLARDLAPEFFEPKITYKLNQDFGAILAEWGLKHAAAGYLNVPLSARNILSEYRLVDRNQLGLFLDFPAIYKEIGSALL